MVSWPPQLPSFWLICPRERRADSLSLDGFAIAIVEPEAVLAELEKTRAALEQVHREVVERGAAVPIPDHLALTPSEFHARVESAAWD